MWIFLNVVYQQWKHLHYVQFCFLSGRVRIYIFCFPAEPCSCQVKVCPGQERLCPSFIPGRCRGGCFFPPSNSTLLWLGNKAWKEESLTNSAQIRDHRKGETQESNSCLGKKKKKKKKFFCIFAKNFFTCGVLCLSNWKSWKSDCWYLPTAL